MKYPKFFDAIETIKIKDDLAEVLGACEDGVIEYSYLDVVKSAGHSCPTIAGAYLMIKEGLKEFDNPKRGQINAYLKDAQDDGVTGVTSNVIAQITGATCQSGFHGIAGKFDRRNLMHFNADIDSSLRLIDASGKIVDLHYNPNKIPPHSTLQGLMQKVMSQQASQNAIEEFKKLWQERVEQILKSPSQVLTIK
jgi:hypothetical protein